MKDALFLMQRKGSQDVVVIKAEDAEKKTGEVSGGFDSCCLLMHLTNLWGESLNARLL